jgi:glucosamine-6-phosphate deaminase
MILMHMSAEPAIACIEIGGSGTQTVMFSSGPPTFVDAPIAPAGAAVGVATPGFVSDGRIVAASTFGWADVDPMAQLGLDGPASLVCNDAEAAALGEWVLRGRTDTVLVYVGIGTGIGGAVVVDGSIVGANLFGHQPGFGSARCTCGAFGCLETQAAGWAMPDPLDGPVLSHAAASIARAIATEPLAARGVIVVGGGIADRYPTLVEQIRAELPAREVQGTIRPSEAKSASAWGVCELMLRNASRIGDQFDLVVAEDVAACAARAADVVQAEVARRPDLVLGVATGATPVATYVELARRGVDLSRAHIYLLDEYVGLAPSDQRSYVATIRTLFGQLFGVAAEQVHGPDSRAADLEEASRRYEAEIKARGGLTLQILGIGRNGHIGFNEPGSGLDTRTRPVELSAATRRDNARFFGSADEVPRRSITQGIGTILDAGALLLIATGSAKERALTAALIGPISSAIPASAIRLHPRATLVADADAAVGVVAARALASTIRTSGER